MGHHHGHGHGHSHGHGGTRRAAAVTLAVNIGLVVLKWTAYLFTGSPSLFAEAAHSTADALNPVLLWFGYRRSKRPPDDAHPYGKGREAFFWSLMAALMMLFVGSFITAAHGVHSLVSGEPPEVSWVAACIMAVAFVSEGYSVAVTLRGMRHGPDGRGDGAKKNPILLALLVENGADMLGVTLATCGYGLYLLTGNPVWDGVFSLCIATLLAISSGYLIVRNLSLITGERATKSMHDRIIDAVRDVDGVTDVRVTAVMSGVDTVSCRIKVRTTMPRRTEERTRSFLAAHERAVHADRAWRSSVRRRVLLAVAEHVPQANDVTVVID